MFNFRKPFILFNKPDDGGGDPPTDPPKNEPKGDEMPGWAKQMQSNLEKILKPQAPETDKGTQTIPVPPVPKTKEEEEDDHQNNNQPPAKKSFLSWLW